MTAALNTIGLLEAHYEMNAPTGFLTKLFWAGKEKYFQTKEIRVDIVKKGRRVAPYVLPVASGTPMARDGYATDTYAPVYLRPMREINIENLFTRQPGLPQEQDERQQKENQARQIAEDLADLEAACDRAEEVQAMGALVNGTFAPLDVNGDALVTTLDYQRNSDNEPTLTSNDRWVAAPTTADPVRDLNNWRRIILENSGAHADVVIMNGVTWAAMISTTKAAAFLNQFRGNVDSETRFKALGAGATFRGILEGFEVYTYDAYYLNASGVSTKMIADNKVIVAAKDMRADRAFGAVAMADDPNSPIKLVATDRLPSIWTQKNPAATMLMLESAPLLIPTAIDATLCASVNG